MSLVLLRQVSGFLEEQQVLTGLAKKYFRWTDKDLAGAGGFVLFRMAGTSGVWDHVLQRPDVQIVVCVSEAEVERGDEQAKAIYDAIAGAAVPEGMVKIEPMGVVAGPFYLKNGRAVFEMTARCITEGY